MIPVTDFNYVVCGFATFAATVGYACTRKLVPSPTVDMDKPPPPEMSDTPIIPPAQPIVESESKISEAALSIESPQPTKSTPRSGTPLVRRESLKRKRAHDEHEEHEETTTSLEYPHNLKSIYPPKKRSRTPSSDADNAEKADKPVQLVVPEPLVIAHKETTEPIVTAEPDEPPRSTSVPLEATKSQPQAAPNKTAPSTPPSLPSPPSTPKPKALSSCTTTPRGFAAFAGSTSPFASSISSAKVNRSPWAEKAFNLHSPNEPDSSPAASRPVNPVEAFTDSQESPSKPAHTHVTGEENEEVELELKGVKLFIKRGSKGFSEGLVGHVKVLSDKSLKSSGERILFRREPLWKVSMNVRLQPAVRCTLDEEENVLRLILTEPASREGDAREIVVYAMKPGRSCSKQEFKEFASSVVDRPGLQKVT
ncbi:hypothetical protein BD779DRAFT_1525483 [Infundibulicybe gibba]|nr:hypothetical protein BD779DRAFT_1525483 [Infundibulicybe gibba]